MLKLALVFLIFLASFFILVPIQSDSEPANYSFAGSGYVISKGNVHDVVIDLALENNGGKLAFKNGNILMGTESHSINDLSLSLSRNGKTIEIDAVADDTIIKMTGKLVASNENGSIYQLSGRADGKNYSQRLVLHALIAPEKTTQAASIGKQEVLLLVEHYNRVEWKSQYKFIVKTFDPKLNPTANFHMTSGFLEGIKIHAAVMDPLGNTIKTSEGVTTKLGYYQDTLIIPDNARTGIYILNVTASGENFKTTSKELTFLVIPLLSPPTAS